MTPGDVRLFLGEDWTEMEALLRSSLESGISLLDTVNATVLSNSGKMLRPMITLLTARACSGKRASKDSIRCAASTELLHNATLMHDDVVDDSKERRGKPTVMSILGGSAAVLVGDYWLTKAMENIFAMDNRKDDVTLLFSRTLTKLAEGEMLQLQKADSGDTSEEDYFRIIYNKTAALFETAAVSGALTSGASDAQVEAARNYSVSLGLAFQIKDDMFDYLSGSEIGKPVGIDLEEQKITLPLLGAMLNAGAAAEAEVRGKVARIHENAAFKDEVRDFVLSNGGIEYASSRLDEYVARAVDALSVLQPSREKEYLAGIAEYTARRDR